MRHAWAGGRLLRGVVRVTLYLALVRAGDPPALQAYAVAHFNQTLSALRGGDRGAGKSQLSQVRRAPGHGKQLSGRPGQRALPALQLDGLGEFELEPRLGVDRCLGAARVQRQRERRPGCGDNDLMTGRDGLDRRRRARWRGGPLLQADFLRCRARVREHADAVVRGSVVVTVVKLEQVMRVRERGRGQSLGVAGGRDRIAPADHERAVRLREQGRGLGLDRAQDRQRRLPLGDVLRERKIDDAPVERQPGRGAEFLCDGSRGRGRPGP